MVMRRWAIKLWWWCRPVSVRWRWRWLSVMWWRGRVSADWQRPLPVWRVNMISFRGMSEVSVLWWTMSAVLFSSMLKGIFGEFGELRLFEVWPIKRIEVLITMDLSKNAMNSMLGMLGNSLCNALQAIAVTKVLGSEVLIALVGNSSLFLVDQELELSHLGPEVIQLSHLLLDVEFWEMFLLDKLQ
jgi:hypothetical protein